MAKSIPFSEQPLFNQLIKLLNRSNVLEISHNCTGECYVKSFSRLASNTG
ncbi:MAG: DUF4372 domain-containing protein [Phocaeicola sp.]